ncbi:hypothetical protein HAX54_029589 [Datura stramonium]|uniref:Uncharacterized protein n=1 Tax=Datura stramonium TaxID=4076 RepID=A0ABS8V8H8_DATST|nr:hypothetical protein [Datura stramonium]
MDQIKSNSQCMLEAIAETGGKLINMKTCIFVFELETLAFYISIFNFTRILFAPLFFYFTLCNVQSYIAHVVILLSFSFDRKNLFHMMVDFIILSFLDNNKMLMCSDFIYLILLEFSNLITSSHTPREFEAA